AAGLTAILPGFYPGGLSPLTEYLPKDAIWVLDDPLELERQWGELWQALEDAFADARKKGELALAPDQHFLHEREMRPALEAAPAERTKRLLLDRNLMAQIVPLREAAFSPHVHAGLVVGEISAGFVDLHSRLALFSDEDVFGPRAQARSAPRRPRTFGAEGADFRDLKEGDLVVHVDHGIAR